MSDPLWGWLDECLAPLGTLRIRRMFGGAGVSLDGLSIGLIADGVLYLKVDAETAPIFAAEGLEPFTFDKDGAPVALSYRRAPDAAFDDPEIMRDWVQLARAAAARATHKPARRRRKGEES